MPETADKSKAAERRYQRASCDFKARFKWGTITHEGRARVVSLGGCFLQTDVIIPIEERVTIQITLADPAEAIEARARVAWISRKNMISNGLERYRGFALEFQDIYPEHRALLDDYVKSRTRIYRAIDHELKRDKPDKPFIKELFQDARPGESTHLNHIKKVCRQELRHFKLRP